MITSQSESFTYADALKKARDNIVLGDLNIQNTKIRRAANGGLLIEVIGPDGTKGANLLAKKLQEVLRDQARVVKPMIKGQLRLIGLDDSTSIEEVKCVVAQNGGCEEEEIRTGPIRPLNNGLFAVWIQCPINAALKLANMKKVRIGWTLARVDLFENRPVQCFRCWRFGHVRFACAAKEDFSGLCFKCRGSGHLARNCNAPLCCKLCLMDVKDTNHRLGSNWCTAEHKLGRSRPNSGMVNPRRPSVTRETSQMELDGH